MNEKNIDIKNYLSTEKYTTRKELIEATKLTDREIRSRISELKKKRVVICSSQSAGYRLAKELKGLTKEEREKEVDLVKHSLNDCKSRTTQLNKQKRKYIAYIKKAEQVALEEDHIPGIENKGAKEC